MHTVYTVLYNFIYHLFYICICMYIYIYICVCICILWVMWVICCYYPQSYIFFYFLYNLSTITFQKLSGSFSRHRSLKETSI